MWMLVKFSDGSNPWYHLNPTKAEAVKYAKYFRKKYGNGAFIFFKKSGSKKELLYDGAGLWFVRYDNKAKTYKRLGDALNFLLKEDKKQ